MVLKSVPFKMGLYAASLPLKVVGKATKFTIALILPIIMMRTFRWMMKSGQSSSRTMGSRTTGSRSRSSGATSSRGMGSEAGSETMGPRMGTFKMPEEEY
ncbi:MAG TPA: hypothetical protein VN455_13055 [Methanotrichaceae archaeon]|nr:hypothetical protein [Methanotrichaceae archaeon]